MGGNFSFAFNEEDLATPLELFAGSLATGGSAALPPGRKSDADR